MLKTKIIGVSETTKKRLRKKRVIMNKKELMVPRGTEFISDWKDYMIPVGHCIVDKGVIG